MAKVKYNPLSAFREDPLAALKEATERPMNGQNAMATALPSERDAQSPLKNSSAGTLIEAREDVPSRASTKPLAATLNTSRNTVYLYPEDLTKLRQLSGYVSSEHGIRANDSMIFRAALALLEPDARLLHALRETEMLDRRRKNRA